jgi:uncharacterized integral membrane protein
MKTAKLVGVVLLVLFLAVAVMQNTAPMQARFLWMEVETPAVILLFLTTLGGFLLGVLATLLLQRERGRKGGKRGQTGGGGAA